VAVDGKYGKTQFPRGTIGEDEPIFVFRAQDKILPIVLEFYATMCEEAGSPPEHINIILTRKNEILAWQENRSNKTKIPSSRDAVIEPMGESESGGV
jgi:hypothetical protein